MKIAEIIRTKFKTPLILVLIFGVMALTQLVVMQSVYERAIKERLKDRAATLYTELVRLLSQEPSSNRQNLLSALIHTENQESITIFDKNKDIIFQTGPIRESAQNIVDHSTRLEVRLKERVTHFMISVPLSDGDSANLGLLKISRPMPALREKWLRSKIILIVTYIAVFLLVVSLAGTLSNQTSKPYTALRRAIEMVSNGHFSYQIKSGDEYGLGPIPKKFNDMVQKISAMMEELETEKRSLATRLKETGKSLSQTEERLDLVLEQLKQSQKNFEQTEKQKSLSAIVSGFAHEINNPLSGIVGFINLMEIRNDLSPYVRSKLESIKVQAMRIKDIIAELNQLNPEKQQIKLEINLNNLVEKLVKIVRPKKSSEGIVFELKFPGKAIIVKGNHFSLWQIFENIVENAVESINDAHRMDGKIQIKVQENPKENLALVEICDNGGGFQNIEKAFDPFYTTKNRTEKKGIGLSIAFNLIHEHNGSIEIINKDIGAVVKFKLPLYKKETTTENKPMEG